MTANSPFRRWRSASSPERARTTSPKSSSTVAMARRFRSSSSTRRTLARSAGGAAVAGSSSGLGATGISPTGPFIGLLGRLERDWRRRGGLRFAAASYPNAYQRKEQLDVDRLGDIIGCAGIEALLPVALHRLCRDCDQRKIGELRALPYLLHR